MIVVFLGPPGVGKGTQAELVCRVKGWRHLSTGVILRDAAEAGTALGLQARKYMDQGNLVPDDVILGLIEETVADDTMGYVLDGFPRTLHQAEDLEQFLASHHRKVYKVIYLRANDEEVAKRMQARGRVDDKPETVRHRLRVYEENTEPLVGHYRKLGLLREVDGVGLIEEIHLRVMEALDN